MTASSKGCCARTCGECCPWALSCPETTLHCIPVIGTITSFGAWICTVKKMRGLSSEEGTPRRTMIYTIVEDGGKYQLLSKQRANRITICTMNLFVSLALAFTAIYYWGDKK